MIHVPPSGYCGLGPAQPSITSRKPGVERYAEYVGTKTPLEAARDMEFLGKEHGPGIGRPPQYGLIAAVPGKDSVSIGFE